MRDMRVIITANVGKQFTNKIGFLESRDGEYFYIRPRWYKHQIELYRTEFKMLDGQPIPREVK